MKRTYLFLLAFCAAFLPGGDGLVFASSANPFAKENALTAPRSTVEETVQLCTHQWLVRDPAYPTGFIANYTSPVLTADPVSITIRTENTNVVKWKWENLHPTESMQNNPPTGTTAWNPAPMLNMSVFHDFWARTEPGVDKLLVSDHHSNIAYTWQGSCTSIGLQPFDGIIDGAGASGWEYQCPSSTCTTTNISSSKEETYLWSAMSEAEKQRWRDGMLIGYRPQVGQSEAMGVGTPCPSTVPWETNHWWWNYSDYRCSVKIIFRANY